jgi:sugar lactone lactonase YvrE
MTSHFVFRVLRALIPFAFFASQLTVAFGQDSPNIITTIVNADRCFTKQVNDRPLVFCGGGFAGDGGPAKSAKLSIPVGVAVDKSGNLFIADNGNRRVRRVDAKAGVITTVAGDTVCPNTRPCDGGFSGDGEVATKAEMKNAFGGIALDADGNLFISDSGNNRVRRVDHATGIITTVAGRGTRGFSGDGGLATSAEFQAPMGVFVDTSGNLFIADSGNRRVRRVEKKTGVITTVAGGGNSCRSRGPVQSPPRDQCLAVNAGLGEIYAVVVDPSGDLYLADWRTSAIRRVDHATGLISWVAGGGCPPQGGSCWAGFEGDGGPAVDARLTGPSSLAMDGAGDLFIADTGNGRVRKIDHATGTITTIAGSGGRDFGRDHQPATRTALNSPMGIAVDDEGNLYIADTNSHSVRKMKLAPSETALQSSRQQ